MADKFYMLINGQLVEGSETFDVINPSTGEPFAKAPHASQSQVDAAAEAALIAFPKWTSLLLEERKACIRKVVEILQLEDNRTSLGELLAKETGKPLPMAYFELDMNIEVTKSYLNLQIPIEVVLDTAESRAEVHHRPMGVVAGITPWNFPVICSFQKWVPALLYGNTFVWKPSPYTPLSSLAIGALLKDALPPGVLNLVTGNDNSSFNVGGYLSRHSKVRKVSFTGSVSTGKAIMAACANDVKRVTLEMGGNDPAIIRADCDPVDVAPKIFAMAMFNSGQVCAAVKRVYVHESIYEQFCQELVKCASGVKLGEQFEEGVEFGPITNELQFNKIKSIVEEAKQKGARILCGGQPLERKGYFYPPTVIADVKEGFRVVDEEQFGPVIPVISYSDDAEAISRANNTEYGLGGSIWSKDILTANRLALQLECGTVWVNEHMGDTNGPGGGFKSSGLGRESGSADLDAYTEIQTLKFAK